MTDVQSEDLKITRYDIHIILFCVSLSIVQLFGIDMYIPSMPWIKESLHTTQMVVQLTIAFYVLGAAISVLFSGPLSDKVGRKPVILLGLMGMMLGSVACMIAQNGTMLLMGRVIQGVGAGFCMSANRAVVTDVFSAKKLSIIGAYFGTLMAISPIVAPIIGGYLEHYYNWRANFVVLTICYFALLIAFQFFFNETIYARHTDKLSIIFILKRYTYLIMQPDFRVYALCGGLTLGLSVAYATAAPYIFEKTLQMTPVAFGWLGIFVGAGNILGKLSTPPLVKRFKMQSVLVCGLFIILFSGVFFAIALSFGWLTIPLVLIAVMISLFGQAYVAGNAFALGITPYRDMGGAANALLSSGQMGLAFVISTALSVSSNHMPESNALAGIYILIGGICLWLFFQYSRNPVKH